MLRYILLIEDVYNIIIYSINNGESGEIIIPKMKLIKIIELIKLYSKKYNKKIKDIGLRPGEKLVEKLLTDIDTTKNLKEKRAKWIVKNTSLRKKRY